jgi:predicted dehydrogenase
MEAFLQLVAEDRVDVRSLITHRFAIHEGVRAYELIGGRTGQPYLGVVLRYAGECLPATRVELGGDRQSEGRRQGAALRVGMLGAGSFAGRVLLPAMKASGNTELAGICSRSGVSAQNNGKKFGFAYATSSEAQLLADDSIDAVVITTPHHLHARQVVAALQAGKHVFCEKPLCLSEGELGEIAAALQASPRLLMAGYNRRFAPMARQLREFISASGEPLMMSYRVNAGAIPRKHWIQDADRGGGRILGEVCHFVDFMTYMTGALPARVWSRVLPNGAAYCDDNVAATLEFSDGSIGCILYVANGDKSLAKERFEAFSGGRAAVLDDFRRLELRYNGRVKLHRALLRQDKGHRSEWCAFADAIVKNRPSPISTAELVATSLATFAMVKSARSGQAEALEVERFLAPSPPQEQERLSISR